MVGTCGTWPGKGKGDVRGGGGRGWTGGIKGGGGVPVDGTIETGAKYKTKPNRDRV